MKVVRISAIWCSSCIITHQKWLSFKEKHPEIECVDLDYDTDDTHTYQVGKILPVTVFMDGERILARIEGEFQEKELEEVIENAKMDF